MDPKLPEWLDATFLAEALQGGEGGVLEVTVKHFSAALAVAVGDNYLSRLYRVRVEYVVQDEERCTSLIVKVPFTKGAISTMVDGGDFYGKEANIYKNLLPIMNDITNCEFCPKLYYICSNNSLILSDLNEEGFVMCDRYKQLDFAHCEQVFKSIAKFHAASVACQRDHTELIQLVGKEMFYCEGELFDNSMRPWLKMALQHVAGIVKELQMSNDVVDFITKKVDTVASSLLNLCKPKVTGLNVLNHGDLWVNNILFRHSSSGDIEDIRLIDFQLAKYASPVLDLIYLIWSSANEDVRESRLPELCELYRLALNSKLEELGCTERLSTEELREDMRSAVDWALVTICNMLPMMICDVDDVINMEETVPDEMKGEIDHKYLKHYKGKHFRAMLPKIMTHFLSWVDYFNHK